MAERLSSFSLLCDAGLFFDLSKKRGDALAIEIVWQAVPAREGIEREDLDGGIGETIEIVSPVRWRLDWETLEKAAWKKEKGLKLNGA